ncbi:hypothetical protein [Corallococcus exercitus]|uniref:hypothetical protein n=1 Tax=Corallococcus exercitus TaxID=2316736 RepID=UPI0011C46538|nr:hypothetical protein [Corallococcus exercitus]
MTTTTRRHARASTTDYVVVAIEPGGEGSIYVTLRDQDEELHHVHLFRYGPDDSNCTQTVKKDDELGKADFHATGLKFIHRRTGAICVGPRFRFLTVIGANAPRSWGSELVLQKGADGKYRNWREPGALVEKKVPVQEVILEDAEGKQFSGVATWGFSAQTSGYAEADCLLAQGDRFAFYLLQQENFEGDQPAMIKRIGKDYAECNFARNALKLPHPFRKETPKPR